VGGRVFLAASLIASAVVALGCGASMPKYDYASEPDPRGREFVLGVSDRIEITVWKNPELSASVIIRPDGEITLPLIGDIRAAGRTPTQLRKLIASRLATYVKDLSAVVTVSVTEVNSYHFTVGGEVVRSGSFASAHYVTLVEAIALAGGFTRFAERDKIVIIRRNGSHKARKIPIVYSAIAKGDNEHMNLVLLAGDTVHVP
jgi:polysaccharide export outer membrane protein